MKNSVTEIMKMRPYMLHIFLLYISLHAKVVSLSERFSLTSKLFKIHINDVNLNRNIPIDLLDTLILLLHFLQWTYAKRFQLKEISSNIKGNLLLKC